MYKVAQLGTVSVMPRSTPVVPAGVEINGSKLRDLRKLRGEGLESFAERCKISFGYLGHIERGDRKTVTPVVFAAICDALDIPADQRTTMVTRAAQRRIKAAA